MNTISLPLRFGRGVRQLYRYAILESFDIVRRQGWRELLRQRGWKFFAAILAYYIVRDTLLYIVIPLCLARELF
jgi:hypothetical protein